MPSIIRWVKPKGAKKYHVTLTRGGKIEHYAVDDIVVDTGSEIRVGGEEESRGWIITDVPCRIVKLEILGKIEEVLACTRKSISELREKVKYI